MHENNKISDYAKEFTEETKNLKRNNFISRLSDMIKNDRIANVLKDGESYCGNLLTDDAISKLKNLLAEYMFDYEKEYFIKALNTVGWDYICQTYATDTSKNQIEIGNILKNNAKRLQNSYSINLNVAWPELKTILSCSDFMSIFDEYELNDKELDKSNDKKCLQTLLDKCKDWSYTDVRKAVNESSLNSQDKKKVFAGVLPKYKFNFYSDFYNTWSVFEDGNIDFDDLVTEVWAANKFDCNDDRYYRSHNNVNVFTRFAWHYIQYLNNDENASDNLGDDAKNMIDVLRQTGVIADNDIQNLKDQIDNATDVGVFGIIAQFFSNLFSKGKTAFKPIQKIKQDRVISNLKPLSGLLGQAAEQNKEGNDKLI